MSDLVGTQIVFFLYGGSFKLIEHMSTRPPIREFQALYFLLEPCSIITKFYAIKFRAIALGQDILKSVRLL